jgi:hypothetical protein
MPELNAPVIFDPDQHFSYKLILKKKFSALWAIVKGGYIPVSLQEKARNEAATNRIFYDFRIQRSCLRK